jgi:hypothetical protein
MHAAGGGAASKEASKIRVLEGAAVGFRDGSPALSSSATVPPQAKRAREAKKTESLGGMETTR